MHYRLQLGQLLVALLVVFAQADYIIDDSNSTIHYSGGVWNRIIHPTFDEDSTKLYNGTL
jgi:hypothetical protein